MNRSALNSQRIGSGTSSALVTAAFSQALRLVGTVGGFVQKFGGFSQSLALSGVVTPKRYVHLRVAGTLAIVGDFIGHAFRYVYVPIAATLAINASVRGYRKVDGKFTHSLLLTGSVTAYDITGTPAPDERQMLVGGLGDRSMHVSGI